MGLPRAAKLLVEAREQHACCHADVAVACSLHARCHLRRDFAVGETNRGSGSDNPRYGDDCHVERESLPRWCGPRKTPIPADPGTSLPVGTEVLEFGAGTCAQAGAGLLDPLQEPRVILQPEVEPIVLRLEPDEHAGRLAVARDHNRPLLGLAQVSGQIVLHLRERHFLHSRLPNLASHASTSDLATMASTSTVSPATS